LPWQPPPDYPARLLCNGRPVDPDFSGTEKLYFRLPLLQLDEEQLDSLPTGKVPSLPFSVNREKYSNPNDVVLGYPDWGIAMIRVQDIPPSLSGFEFRVRHLPVDDDDANNYSHAEVKAFQDGKEVDHKNIPKSVKIAFRTVLSRRAKIFKQPGRVPIV
jgi:hypothetical protein